MAGPTERKNLPLTAWEAERLAGQVLMAISLFTTEYAAERERDRALLLRLVKRQRRQLRRLARLIKLRLAPLPHEPTGCLRDICLVLRQAGRRLTTTGILDALAKGGLGWGEATVKFTLSAAVEAGILTNDQKANPRGYSIPEQYTGEGSILPAQY